MADTSIRSKSALARLKARREPYWARISKGCFIGYRKLPSGLGTWIARWRDEEGRQKYRTLGERADYDDAVSEASTWFSENAAGARPEAANVAEACRVYVDHIGMEKGEATARDAEGRFRRLIYDRPIGRIELSKLRSTDVKKWRNAQIASIDEEEIDPDEVRRSKDSANRNLASLKAALNQALRDRLVATDSGWKTVTAFPSVGKRRETFLLLAERQSLLNACPDDLALLVKALLLTAARPGEIAALRACDFDKSVGTLALTGKTGRRVVSLSTAAFEFFVQAASGKIGNALILTRSDGNGWDKDAWKKSFRKAASRAGLPINVIMYSLRHTAISELILGGMDTFLVARLAGTSTAMVDQHYGHLRHDVARRRLDTVRMI